MMQRISSSDTRKHSRLLVGQMSGYCYFFFLRNAIRMAVFAFYEMHVVFAVLVFERGIHFFDVDAAIRQARMTGGARCAGLQAVFGVTRQATESFMHSNWRAVVGRVDL